MATPDINIIFGPAFPVITQGEGVGLEVQAETSVTPFVYPLDEFGFSTSEEPTSGGEGIPKRFLTTHFDDPRQALTIWVNGGADVLDYTFNITPQVGVKYTWLQLKADPSSFDGSVEGQLALNQMDIHEFMVTLGVEGGIDAYIDSDFRLPFHVMFHVQGGGSVIKNPVGDGHINGGGQEDYSIENNKEAPLINGGVVLGANLAGLVLFFDIRGGIEQGIKVEGKEFTTLDSEGNPVTHSAHLEMGGGLRPERANVQRTGSHTTFVVSYDFGWLIAGNERRILRERTTTSLDEEWGSDESVLASAETQRKLTDIERETGLDLTLFDNLMTPPLLRSARQAAAQEEQETVYLVLVLSADQLQASSDL